jgi:Holliday junction resolvasome RuvABC endonuclease subunit
MWYYYHMGLGNLMKVKAKRVCGIDASTNSLAFAVFEGTTPIHCGEVKFQGATVFERLKDAKAKTRALVAAGILEADYVAIESAIMVRNVQVAIDLAYVYGAIIGELMVSNPQVHKIAPISWQSGIGNPNLKKEEKLAIQKEFPGKSKSWYQNKGREIRKGRTLGIARQYFSIPSDSDNIGDAVGLALYTVKSLTRS